MPRLNLIFIRRDRQLLGTDEIYYERIAATLSIGPTGNVIRDCWIDTGAPLSMFPEVEWTRFQKDITWLTSAGAGVPLPIWLSHNWSWGYVYSLSNR